jgi:hypothetical protein
VTTTYPNSPNHARAALILMDASTGNYERIIRLQLNPSQLTRSVKAMGSGGDGGDRGEAQRLTGPPRETIQLEAELDATDQLEKPDSHARAVEYGLRPEIAALERIVYPASETVESNASLAQLGMLEVLPAESPLTLFYWGKNRLLPVLIQDIGVTELAFDQALNPILAQVTLSMQVLTSYDLPFGHRGRDLYADHHKLVERLAGPAPAFRPGAGPLAGILGQLTGRGG